jgi:hypothetical protein
VIFSEATRTRLLGSIEASRLVLLCGAGLSIPSPSGLLSAVRVAQVCYDRYEPTKTLPPCMRDRIDEIAGHFYSTGEFESLFVGRLVPWNDLVGQPNAGHAAVADLLITKGAVCALSANFDTLIEQWASAKKIAMRGALDGHEATAFATEISPLIKFHGCLMRNREQTIWTQNQTREPAIADRIATCSEWMKLNLPGKDILVVGFWTDWGYLNEVIAKALAVRGFGSVTVVDPLSAAALETKAPQLWKSLSDATAHFEHVQASGGEALTELRTAFSKVWLKKFYQLGRPLLEQEGKPYAAIDPDMASDDLYASRCDAESRPSNSAALTKEPAKDTAQAAFFHHLLVQAAAIRIGSWYDYAGMCIRVIQGAGEALNTVRERHSEPPAAAQPDIVVCAGAVDIPLPGKILGSGTGASVVRPAPGGAARWLTLDDARGEFRI